MDFDVYMVVCFRYMDLNELPKQISVRKVLHLHSKFHFNAGPMKIV